MKCPGQDTRFWNGDDIFEARCPKCGEPVEFFKDDTTRACSACGHKFLNPGMDFGCAAYCPHAEQCIGNLPPELLEQRENLLKDRIAVEMKQYFRQDFKRIGHAMKVARYAEAIGKETPGVNMAVVLCAAYLHDIGIHEAERKHGSTAARFQEQEGPPIARAILEKAGAKPELVDAVCDIVGHHHHPRETETIDFKVVYDADLIVNVQETGRGASPDKEKLKKIIDNQMLTDAGKALAKKEL
ncbi:MAG: HD domain-containing protein [Thermodesulfobacteriota bacterium]|nr:HD domain-containing protein [Thermodesulfobacteriota bacterium]